MNKRNLRMMTCTIACWLAGTGAMADVTMKQQFKVDAFGAMAILASEGTVTTSIADRKLRSDTEVLNQSTLAQQFSRNANTSTLVLLDEQRMITLMPERQQYSEMSFEQLRAQLDYGNQTQEDAASSAEVVDLPVEEGECRWSLPDMNVIHTGEKAKFAGVKAEQHLITVTQTCTVPDAGQACEMTWHLEHWTAKRMPGDDEAREFEDELARALGGEDVLSAAKLSAGSLLALFRRGWNQVLAESERMEGYPVRTVMSMEIGGDRCTTGAGTPIAYDSDWSVMQDIAKETAQNTAQSTATNAAAQTAARSVGGGLGGSVAGAAVSETGRRLFDRFKRKKKAEEEARKAEAEASVAGNPEDASVMLFRVTTELTSVSKDKVRGDRFQWPDKWEKISP